MTRIAIAALAAVLSTSASAHISAIRIEGTTAHIGYKDLNLQSHTDRAKLEGRIRSAAGRICADSNSSFQPVASGNECYRIAVGSGLEQLQAAAGSSAVR